jgi:hypothetical protein
MPSDRQPQRDDADDGQEPEFAELGEQDKVS